MTAQTVDLEVYKATISINNRRSTKSETRQFEAFSSSLAELRDRCKSEEGSPIAIESTGIYWKSVYSILEEDVKIIMVNACHIKTGSQST